MKQAICGYRKDDNDDWVAKLTCGHYQHVRHKPPFVNRPWVVNEEGRRSMLGVKLECKKCDDGDPVDYS